jgi:hypothetical protein
MEKTRRREQLNGFGRKGMINVDDDDIVVYLCGATKNKTS